MTFQEIILALENYWSDYGCVIRSPFDIESGAGTFHPATFFGVLKKNMPYNVGFIQPSRRPKDGRYGLNPNRLQHFYQYQVILQPAPEDSQDLYIDSLRSIGIKPEEHDIRFVEDDWESPTLGAWGLGWEVWLDGMEITQFTYFQQVGGYTLEETPVELTYGLERLAMYIQKVNDYRDLMWNKDTKYGEIYFRNEQEQSSYNFEFANIKVLKELFEVHEKESFRLVKKDLAFPAYEQCVKCSHYFNLLDSRGAISVSQRTDYISRIRKMAAQCAKLFYTKERGEE